MTVTLGQVWLTAASFSGGALIGAHLFDAPSDRLATALITAALLAACLSLRALTQRGRR